MKPSLTCREFVEFLDRYLSGELPAETSACFEEHLSRCPTCSAYATTYRRTVALARRAFDADEDPVSGVPDELVLAILAATHRPR